MVINLIDTISAAITNRRCLKIRYKGQSEPRYVEPHMLYRTPSNRYILESYQLRGHSSGGRVPPFWRPFRLRKITSVQVLDEVFEPRVVEGYQTIRKMVTGDLLCAVDADGSEYGYFNSGVYGPPKPGPEVTRRLRSFG
jgi:hypothetical protein